MANLNGVIVRLYVDTPFDDQITRGFGDKLLNLRGGSSITFNASTREVENLMASGRGGVNGAVHSDGLDLVLSSNSEYPALKFSLGGAYPLGYGVGNIEVSWNAGVKMDMGDTGVGNSATSGLRKSPADLYSMAVLKRVEQRSTTKTMKPLNQRILIQNEVFIH